MPDDECVHASTTRPNASGTHAEPNASMRPPLTRGRSTGRIAEQTGSPHRWTMARCFTELQGRGWSVRRIAEACGVGKSAVSVYIRALSGYPDTGVPFWQAYSEVTGEAPHVSQNSGDIPASPAEDDIASPSSLAAWLEQDDQRRAALMAAGRARLRERGRRGTSCGPGSSAAPDVGRRP